MAEDERPDLAAVLEHYDVRIRGGVKMMVQCPLHTDKTPSCSVNLDKQLWNCKSCGEKGDSYNLIMLKEGIDFVRARAFAATLGFATGGVGGSDDQVSGSLYGARRSVPSRKGDRPKRGSYKPAWRRD